MEKYQGYAEYKESGVEWLGKIPSHWALTKIKFITHCLDGARVPLNSVERSMMQGNIPYWGANKIVDYVSDYLFDDELVLIGEDGAPFFDPNRDVAFRVKGKIWPNNHVHVLLPDHSKINARFLTYALNCADFYLYISGSTRDKLNQSDLNEIYIRISNLKETTTIANFLDYETAKIDTLIEKQQQLIKLLKEKRQAVISHAVTKGLDPNARMKDSGVEWLGEVPEGWGVKQAKYIAEITRGAILRPVDAPEYFDDCGEWAYLNISDVTKCDKYLMKSKLRLSPLGSTKSARVFPGNVIITASATIGKAFINKIKVCVHDGFIPFCKLKVDKSYLYHYLSNPFLYAAMGKSNTQKNIYLDEVKNMMVTVPPDNEQKYIVKYVEDSSISFSKLINKAEVAIGLMKERRTALISAAVTGKIDVRNFTPPEPAKTASASEVLCD